MKDYAKEVNKSIDKSLEARARSIRFRIESNNLLIQSITEDNHSLYEELRLTNGEKLKKL